MDDQPSSRRLRASDADRDAILALLNEAHAVGRLGVADLRERQEAALHAVFVDELPPLVADLPEGVGWGAPAGLAAPGSAMVPRSGKAVVTPDGVTMTASVMSGRRIDLEPGQSVRSIAVMGGDDIHLGAALGPGVTLILELHSLMGGNNVYVPSGVRIVEETHGVMGGNDIRKRAQGDGSNGTLILRGWQVIGGNYVKLEKNEWWS
ncbi:MAG: DUF1707 domain-containing protein [Propionibacteriaceae bacterium]|nr:DUF1707 domain-containing protein [Propionibacteriaceae bacterium]